MDNVIELELGDGPTPGTYAVRVIRSVAGGEPVGTFVADVEALLAQRQLIEATVLASSVPSRRVVGPAEQPLRELGRTLFERLFTGPVGGAYRASAGVARDRGEGLQLVLRLTAPGLAALPWESMFDPETGSYLARKEPLVRHVPGPHTPEVLRIEPPLRVLGMVSSPLGLPALDVEVEKDRLEQALEKQVRSGRVELSWLEDVSWPGLHARLLEGPWHVLHFVGHGGYDTETDEGVLALVGRRGRADLVEASRFADLLDQAEPDPRLVVLNSCQSGTSGPNDLFSGTAAALVRSGIHAVAAMQFAVSDDAAIEFARAFYTALAHGRGIDDAVSSGRIGILGLGPNTLEWVTPVLYLRGAGTQLFSFPTEIPTGTPSRHEPPPPPPDPSADREPSPEPSPPPAPKRSPEPPPSRAPEPTRTPEPARTPEPPPSRAPEPARPPEPPPSHTPEPARPPEPPPSRAPEPTGTSEPPPSTPPATSTAPSSRAPSGTPHGPPPDRRSAWGPVRGTGGPPPTVPTSRDAVRSGAAVAGAVVGGSSGVAPGPPVVPATGPTRPPVRPPGGGRRSRRRPLLAVLLVAVAAVGAVVWSPWGSSRGVTVEVPATRIWTDTGVRCEAGDQLDITVTGTASHERGSPRATVGPEGRDDPAYYPFNVGPGLETANHLAVIAAVDRQPPFSVVGAGTTYTCERAGVLHLGVNDSGVDDNTGAFRAVVTPRDGS